MTARSVELPHALVRGLPLLVMAAFLAVLHGPIPTTGRDWVFGMAAAALAVGGGRFPFAVLLGQTVLLLAGASASTALPMMFVFTIVTLGELWVRHDGWPACVGAAAFTGAQLVLYWPHYHPVLSTASLAVTTLPPVALGAYIRAVRSRALDADRGRDEAVLAARVAERTAIARELHDLVAHHMASIAVQVGAARHTLNGAYPKVAEALDQAHATSRAALTDLKRLMGILRDPAAVAEEPGAAVGTPDGLPTALAVAVGNARAAGVVVDADLDADLADLDSIRRLAVLRVVQEGLTNVVKHAGPATHATVRARIDGTTVRITITDDGGPGVPTTRRPGFGLVGMRERIELLEGSVDVDRRAPGWSLVVTMPAGDQP